MITILVILLALLQIADLVTTYKGLKMGKKEANPIGRWLLRKLGFIGLVLPKIAVTGFIGWLAYQNYTSGLVLLILTNLMMGYVFYHNMKVIRD